MGPPNKLSGGKAVNASHIWLGAPLSEIAGTYRYRTIVRHKRSFVLQSTGQNLPLKNKHHDSRPQMISTRLAFSAIMAVALIAFTPACSQKQDPRQLYEQGKTELAKGDTAKAKELFKRAVAIEPKIADAQYRLGSLLLKEEKAKEALPHLEAAAMQKPRTATFQFRLGEAYLKLHDNELAINALKTAMEIDPKMGGPYVKLAKAYRRAGREADATAVITQGLEAVPKSDGFYSELEGARDAGASAK